MAEPNYDDMLSEIDDQGVGLTRWERDFCERMMLESDDDSCWHPTPDQAAKIQQIWEERVP